MMTTTSPAALEVPQRQVSAGFASRAASLLSSRWKNCAYFLLLCFLLGREGYGGTITGQLQTATGGVVKNATLTFALSQPAVLSGTASLVTAPVSCYTSTAGNIVGLPDPLTLPVVTPNTASGTLAAGTYYVKLTYAGAGGETIAGPETTVVLSAQGTLIVSAPVLQPASATGYKVYISATSGTETLQSSITGFGSYSQTSALVNGAALPSSNSTVCTLVFSDQLIPTGTYYSVSLVNKNGAGLAGFPQTWCTYGGQSGTINVSNGAPTGNCLTNGVFYPTPIFANPQNNASQSISGPMAFPGGIFGNMTVAGNDSFTGNETFSGANTFSGSNTFSATNTHSGTETFNGPVNLNALNTVTNAGVFTNTQTNEYFQSLIGGCSTSEYNTVQVGNFTTDALAGCAAMPQSATVHQVNALAGYVTNSVNASQTGGAVAGYFQGRQLANNGSIWSANELVQDVGGLTGHQMISNEIDVNVLGTPARAWGILISGASTGTIPALGSAAGLEIRSPGYVGGSVLHWPASINIPDGSGTLGINFGTLATGNSQASMPIQFTGRDGGGATHTVSISGSSAGTLNLNGAVQKLNIQDKGQCTMSSGACSAQTLNNTYTNPPICEVTWTGTGTLAGSIKVASSTTTVTPSSSTGTDTAVVNWTCVGG